MPEENKTAEVITTTQPMEKSLEENKESRKHLSPASDFLEEVKTLLQGSNAEVRKRLLDTYVNREVEERVLVLDLLLKKRKEVSNELNKLRPDQKFLNGEGEVQHELYSPEQAKKRKEAIELLSKLDKAFTDASKGDFKRARELTGK